MNNFQFITKKKTKPANPVVVEAEVAVNKSIGQNCTYIFLNKFYKFITFITIYKHV